MEREGVEREVGVIWGFFSSTTSTETLTGEGLGLEGEVKVETAPIVGEERGLLLSGVEVSTTTLGVGSLELTPEKCWEGSFALFLSSPAPEVGGGGGGGGERGGNPVGGFFLEEEG